jgi:hypothetical protein
MELRDSQFVSFLSVRDIVRLITLHTILWDGEMGLRVKFWTEELKRSLYANGALILT